MKTKEVSYEEVKIDFKEFIHLALGLNEILDFESDLVVYKTKNDVVKTVIVVDVFDYTNIKMFLYKNGGLL